jgi:hypothetical protein
MLAKFIPDQAFNPALNGWRFVSTQVIDGLKLLVGCHFDYRFCGSGVDCLFGNFNSTRGEDRASQASLRIWFFFVDQPISAEIPDVNPP